ncbi:YchJ family metal-binding protein [Kribbella sp. NBC_00382]|uniref:YchJ family protein n=1 Tax=Kribbella sp. NBC_00382 TaxID=2975967 RepID=UPI002E1F8B18
MVKRTACPCGLDAVYADCCGGIHDGRRQAATAEQLMRSRYSAFAVRDAQYLLRSWYSATRPRELHLEDDIEWTSLEILNTTAGTAFHTEGTVEFRANYIADSQPGDQSENSHFVRENGNWVYDGPVS